MLQFSKLVSGGRIIQQSGVAMKPMRVSNKNLLTRDCARPPSGTSNRTLGNYQAVILLVDGSARGLGSSVRFESELELSRAWPASQGWLCQLAVCLLCAMHSPASIAEQW